MVCSTIDPFLLPQGVSVLVEQFSDDLWIVEGARTQIECPGGLCQLLDVLLGLAIIIFDKVNWVASLLLYLPGFAYQVSQ